MGRAKTQAKRRGGAGTSKQGGKAVGTAPGVSKFSGTERPDRPTKNPTDIADPVARVQGRQVPNPKS